MAVAMVAWALGGCLSDPALLECAEFPLRTEGCPSPCRTYCEVVVEACASLYGEGEAAGTRLSTCEAACLEQLSDEGMLGDLTGDTLQCRVTHALLARDTPAVSCLDAALDGGEACVAQRGAGCETYCDLMTEHCASVYPNRDNCLGSCETFPGGPDDTDSDSFECRERYARAAASDASACNKAAITGGGVCGTPCEGYCDQVLANCSDAMDVVYADRPTCLQMCGLLDGTAPADDWRDEGDSVQCRAYHGSAPASFDSQTHCPHAALYNDVHCGTRCGTYCSIMAAECPGTYPGEGECASRCEALGPEAALYPFPDPVDACTR